MAMTFRLDLRQCRAARTLAAFGLALVIAGGAARGESPASAEAAATFLSAFRDQGTMVLADPGLGPDGRRSAVRRLLTARFDLQALSRCELGRPAPGRLRERDPGVGPGPA